MDKMFQIILIIIAGASVAIADGFIKKAAYNTDSYISVLKNPLVFFATLFYFIQILVFSYIFVKRWNLGVVGLMQMIIYSVIVIAAGIMFFDEKISSTNKIGLLLALIASLLMNV